MIKLKETGKPRIREKMTTPSRRKLVLDTSLFSNPETRRCFGNDIETAITNFLSMSRKNEVELYMPISIYRELSNFAQEQVMKEFRRTSTVRAPDLHDLRVPAAILHSFINDLRERVNRGLRLAEEAIRSEHSADNIRWIRRRYRDVLRTGIVDSVEDLDVVLLAREVGGSVLSADQGIANMAEKLGIEVFSAEDVINRYGRE